MKNKISHVFFNSFWIGLEKGLKILFTLAVLVYMARNFSVAEYGNYNLLVASLNIFMAFSAVGLNAVLVKFFRLEYDTKKYIKAALILRSIGVFLSYVLGIITGFVIFQENYLGQLNALLLLALLYMPTQVFEFFFESNLRSKINSSIKITSYVIVFPLKLYSISISNFELLIVFHLSEFLLIMFLNTLFFTKYSAISLKYLFSLNVQKSDLKKLIKPSWPLLISSVGVILYMKIDQFIIYKLVDETQVGVYSAASRLLEAAFLLPGILMSSFFPFLLNQLKISESLFKKYLRNIIRIGVLFSIIFSLIIWFTNSIIIDILYGPEYANAAPVLAVYSISMIWVVLGQVYSKWIIINDLTILSISRHFSGLLINIVLNLLLIPRYGIIAAAIATLFSYFFSVFGFNLLNKKNLEFLNEIFIAIGLKK